MDIVAPAHLTSRDGGNAGDCREQSLPCACAASAHPCARGIPFVLNIKKAPGVSGAGGIQFRDISPETAGVFVKAGVAGTYG